MNSPAKANPLVVDIRHERDRFVAFAFASADVFLEIDEQLNIVYGAGATHWLLGREPNPEVNDNVLDFVAPHNAKLFTAACRMAKKQGRFGPLQIAFCRPHSQRAVQVEVSGTHLPTDGGRIYLAIHARSLEQAAVAKAKRSEPADTPEQARQVFGDTAASVAEAAMAGGQEVSLTLFNLEGLERLRKSLAPQAAAELTADIEAQLSSCSLGPTSVAQVGEEEFGLLHRGEMNVSDLEDSIADCALTYDSDGIAVRSQTVEITTSELSETDLANAVVYAIQKFTETKGEFTISDLSLGFQGMMSETAPRIAELKEVIKDRAFALAYQPIVDLQHRRVHHYEVLVRFHDSGGQSSPFERISFAEDVGLIPALDLAICQMAIDVMRDAEAANHELSLAVNLSGKSLETPIFIQRLHQLLKRAQPFRHRLLFEVTESSKIIDLEATNNVLRSLRERGHKVCLDDFGAGASAFQYLRALSIDYVKIDGSYIRELTADQSKRAFVRSMTTLCEDLKIETIGEMIEDEATVGILRSVGVQYGQGYLFGKPSLNRPE